MGDAEEEWVVVYRGLVANTVDMVESMLEAEGLQPLRDGRASPALAGVGMHAVEQRISVLASSAQSARSLIEAFDAGVDADTLADLEEQAIHAEPVADEAPATDSSGQFGIRHVLAFAAMVALAVWLARAAP